MAQKQAAKKSGGGRSANGHEDRLASFEQELAEYLQKRIKPGLNSGAIPLLARSIAKDIAHRERPPEASGEGDAEDEPAPGNEDEPTGEAGQEPEAETDDEEPEAEAGDEEPEAEGEDEDEAEAGEEPEAEGDEQPEFEAEMHDLQSELGEDWIVRFSVQGDDEWLTAEKQDGTQRIEAETADVLVEAVGLLKERGR